MIEIKFDNTDTKVFKEVIDTIVGNLMKRFNRDKNSVVQIKNWFDPKWLNYYGKQILKYPK